jgi:hypothetical protein
MRRRTQLALIGLVALVLAAASLLGGAVRERGQAGAAVAPGDAAVSADRILTGFSAAGGTDTRALERAVREHPDARSLVLLGYAYQQRWRETAYASNLPLS